MFACLSLLVFTAVLAHAYDQKCTTCADGVESYYDGCNNCSCGDGFSKAGACTELFCTQEFYPETSCQRKCDGYMALKSTDGETRCRCKSGKMTNDCTTPEPPAAPAGQCVDCKTKGVTSFFDGCNQCTCTDSGLAACTKKFCAAAVSKDCSGKCDGAIAFNPDNNADCVCKGGEFSDECKPRNTCYSCNTPGVTSFFDGCNRCSCTEDGLARCTLRACIQVVSKDCSGKCDGATAFNPAVGADCVCMNGEFSDKCDAAPGPRTCKAEGNRVCAADGETCKDVPRKCLNCAMYDCIDACEAEGNSVCRAEGKKCAVSPKQCLTTPCPQYDCVDAPDACEAEGNAVCAAKDMQCKPSPKQCITTPCPQYDCVTTPNACEAEGNRVCAAKDMQCFLEPKQCFTTPCPQYGCRAVKGEECGCDADSPRCAHGKACVNNKCRDAQLPELPEGVADGAPACIRGFGQCCGPNQAFCDDDSICHNNQCIKREDCPAPAEECGCDAEKPRCDRGKACVNNKCVNAQLPELPEGIADGAPACIRGFGQCCGPNQAFCEDSSICHNNKCIAADECPAPAEECGCDAEKQICDSGSVCVANKCKPIDFSPFAADGAPLCIRGPVDGQFCCGESLKACDRGQVCHNDECVDVDTCDATSVSTVEGSGTEESAEACGCDDGICAADSVCVNNECVVSAALARECSADADQGEHCCGKALRVCKDGQVCDNNKCLDKDSCDVAEESTVEFDTGSSASTVIVSAALAVAAIGVASM
eukprot:TRINITY_DN3436_c0_g3_i1.p1 TRINITY_DN3436_c0_g3~~TRINITY_DN3436_c0_g3_i1.p1  ORF type:complete len:777 (+),score=310.91 TRINITY_DN3436_c0_g3_i1:48-2333(+)